MHIEAYEETEWLPRNTIKTDDDVNSSGKQRREREPTVSIPVNARTSDGERDLTVSNHVTVESSGGECKPVVPITPAVPLINPATASSNSTVGDERLCEEVNEQFTKQTNNLRNKRTNIQELSKCVIVESISKKRISSLK